MEIEIERSRFIAQVKRAEREEEALSFIEGIRKKRWDATHHCSAYLIGETDQIQKANDDGEPSGTAGRPILEVLKKRHLKDTVVVVTRYFGGIKLGAGGLIRAYGKAATRGIDAAQVIEKILHRVIATRIPYTLLGRVENELRNRAHRIAHLEYTDAVTIHVEVPVGEEESFMAWMTDLTYGQGEIHGLETRYVDFLVQQHPSEEE